MKLTEILDSKIPSDVVTADAGKFVTTFVTGEGDNLHRFVFTAALEEDEENAWEISFYELKNNVKTFKATGRGDEFKVLSFVSQSTEEFIARYHPEVFSFSANIEPGESGSRANVYKKMFDRKLKGYVAADNVRTSSNGSDIILFKYHRVD